MSDVATIGSVLKETAERLSRANLQCADPKMHAQQILAYALGCSASHLYAYPERSLTPVELARLHHLISRRLEGEPFQYLVGYEWFWESPFEVGQGVLIPRKETEILVEALLQLPEVPALKVAELGAGSGNIGISVLRRRPHWTWEGYEKNPETLKYLSANVTGLLGNGSGYRIIASDFFDVSFPNNTYDLVVSNPPYVVTSELAELSLEVKREPRLALDGGESGLTVIDNYFDRAQAMLKPGAFSYCEVGKGQAVVVAERLSRKGWERVTLLKDYAGIERVVFAQKNGRGN